VTAGLHGITPLELLLLLLVVSPELLLLLLLLLLLDSPPVPPAPASGGQIVPPELQLRDSGPEHPAYPRAPTGNEISKAPAVVNRVKNRRESIVTLQRMLARPNAQSSALRTTASFSVHGRFDREADKPKLVKR